MLRLRNFDLLNRRAWIGFWILIAFGASACGGVAPYQREDLARPTMDTQTETQQIGFQAHVHETREGATGGYGAMGGGCGCN